jgi:hypothetical protein
VKMVLAASGPVSSATGKAVVGRLVRPGRRAEDL